MNDVAENLLKLAREVAGRDYKKESGLTEDQWRDLEKGLKGWLRKARSNLMGQKGPVITQAKMSSPKYDGKWIRAAWPLEDHHLRRCAEPARHDRALRHLGSDQPCRL